MNKKDPYNKKTELLKLNALVELRLLTVDIVYLLRATNAQ